MECCICNRPIIGNYYIDQYGHKICFSHVQNGEAVHCFSCGTIMLDNNNRQPADGRKLCPSCQAQVVSDPVQVEKIKGRVIYWMNDAGIEFSDHKLSDVPVFIVSAMELARLRHTPVSLANKGVTYTQWGNTLFGIAMGRQSKMTHRVYILEHLIKPEFAATLAHEFMHIWQNENGIKLAPPLCEGLCNLASWVVYNRHANYSVPHLKKSLMENVDPVYGDGFRAIYKLYEEIGIDELLKRAKTNML